MRFLIKAIAIIYLIACIGLYLVQDRFLFNPEHISETYQYRMGEEREIPLDGEVTMNTLFISSGNPKPKGVIMYLHGNRGSIRFGIYQVRHMQGLGYDIFIPDYRSYGKTEGKIQSEKQLYTDVQRAYDYLKETYAEDQIVLIGYSLGTGMASYLASQNNPSRLVLIAPFTSITDIKNKYLWFFPDFLLKFKLPVEEFLEKVSCPVTIVHGTRDNIVDYQFSTTLESRFGEKIELVTADRESHRGIIFSRELATTLNRLLAIQ